MVVTIVTVNVFDAGDLDKVLTYVVGGLFDDHAKTKWCDRAEEDYGNCEIHFRPQELGSLSDAEAICRRDPVVKFRSDGGPTIKPNLPCLTVDCREYWIDASDRTYFNGSVRVTDLEGNTHKIGCYGDGGDENAPYWDVMAKVGELLGFSARWVEEDMFSDVFRNVVNPGSMFYVMLESDEIVFTPVGDEVERLPCPEVQD